MRLITRSDFDGLASAVLLVEKGVVDEYKFVHPKDIQDGKVEVTDNDVLANIPYVPGCGMWFDHHVSEGERLDIKKLKFQGNARPAPSAAQVIWDFYGGEETFGKHFLNLIDAVNKTDTGNLERKEILNPKEWILLSFIMDPRTGLGRFHDFRISNYALMEDMIQYCRTKKAKEILAIPDVQERTTLYHEQQALFQDMLKRCCQIHGNVIVTNLLNEETIYSGNRFLVYAVYPEQNIEVRVMWGREKKNVVFACGNSILNRTSQTNLGKLMLEYGGGGHKRVATCQIPIEDHERVFEEIIKRIQKVG